ncbi:hypothetical protein GQ44DRAFT_716089 [Phaeosphaeriaceae sp. PMI808]|nr:hypothetical protein GQ44DRAFT_716089 [Phaeosphaeriaceae sp. PMI808]
MPTQQPPQRSNKRWASQLVSRFKNRGSILPQVTRPPLPSYAETISREPGDAITAAEPRECRKLLREIYALNVYISNLGDVFEVDKPIVLAKQRQAVGALADIRRIVKDWMENEGEWTVAELAIITQICDRIEALRPMPLVSDNDGITGNFIHEI